MSIIKLTELNEQVDNTENNPFAGISTQPGQVMVFTDDDSHNAVGSFLVTDLVLINDDADIEEASSLASDQENVFNNWERISLAVADAQPYTTKAYNADELNAWVYDATSQRIYCTKNSASTVGFVSPDTSDDFVFETIIQNYDQGWDISNSESPNDADDDFVGLLIGLVEDETGIWPLTYMRTCGSKSASSSNGMLPWLAGIWTGNDFWPVELDTAQCIASTTAFTITSPAGVIGPNNNLQGWRAWPGGCKIKVTRKGNTVTCESSELCATYADVIAAPYVDAAKLTFDLSTDERTIKFVGPQRFGYICQSQIWSNWEALQSPAKQGSIYNPTTGSFWVWDDTTKTYVKSTDSEPLLKGVFYRDLETNMLYYLDANNVLCPLKQGFTNE